MAYHLNLPIWQLKQIGHDLIDECVALDTSAVKISSKKEKVFKELGKRLENQPFHFNVMTTQSEVSKANNELRRIIKKTRQDAEKREKNKIAPNVRELQRQASELNKNLLMP